MRGAGRHRRFAGRTRTARAIIATLPSRLRHARELARRLTRDRGDRVLSDFDPVSGWAARLAGVPSAGVAGNYRITHTDGPGLDAPLARALALPILAACSAGLARVFAVSFVAAALGKPILTVPIRGQYEALYNANQVVYAGLGVAADTLSPSAIARLTALPLCPDRPMADGGARVFAALGL